MRGRAEGRRRAAGERRQGRRPSLAGSRLGRHVRRLKVDRTLLGQCKLPERRRRVSPATSRFRTESVERDQGSHRELPAGLHRVGALGAGGGDQQHLLALPSDERDESRAAAHESRLAAGRRRCPSLPEVADRERADVEPSLDVPDGILVARNEGDVAGDGRAWQSRHRRRVRADQEPTVAELVDGWYRGHGRLEKDRVRCEGGRREMRVRGGVARRTVGPFEANRIGRAALARRLRPEASVPNFSSPLLRVGYREQRPRRPTKGQHSVRGRRLKKGRGGPSSHLHDGRNPRRKRAALTRRDVG